MTIPTDHELREWLADLEHQRCAHWQTYLHSRCARNDDGSLTIPAEFVARCSKDSDRVEVDRYWPLVMELVQELRDEITHLATYKLSAMTLAARFDDVTELVGVPVGTFWPAVRSIIAQLVKDSGRRP